MKDSIIHQNIVYLDDQWKRAGREIQDLIALLQVNWSTYCRWRSGKTIPDSYNTKIIADVIGVMPQTLTSELLETLDYPSIFLKKLHVYTLIEEASDEAINCLYEYLKDGYLSEDLPSDAFQK